MPRHSTLIPLSHDHHEALLIALRLKKGGPTSQHDHLWPTEPVKQLHYLKAFFQNELLPHFKLEEEILFPVANKVDELRPLVEMLLAQHALMKEIIGQISMNDGIDEVMKNTLTDFGLQLESHIRTEERELFPKMEEAEAQGRVVLPKLK